MELMEKWLSIGNSPRGKSFSPSCGPGTKPLPEKVDCSPSTISCYISSRIICLEIEFRVLIGSNTASHCFSPLLLSPSLLVVMQILTPNEGLIQVCYELDSLNHFGHS